MSFVSPEFAFAALLFYPVYWLLKPYRQVQLLLLVVASYALYATWSAHFAGVLFLFSTYIWLAGWWLSSLKSGLLRKCCAGLCVLVSLSVLFTTKYYQFARELLVSLFSSLDRAQLLPLLDIVAPTAISFFTFQAITYLVWSYSERPGRMSYLRLLLFLSFWPTLFAGPILRAKDFFRQLDSNEIGEPREIERAAYYLLLGLTQKLVCANWLATTFVDAGFRYPDSHTAVSSAATIVAYSLQILFDFGGYSLIVTALALLLGFSVPINFRQPHLARNLGDFWRRWHISLSLFIRDYIYIPLGGNRCHFVRTQCNILLAMVLSGIWHGANTTFVVWGLLHGVGVVGVNLWRSVFKGDLPVSVARTLTLAYVGLAWVFFRADSCETALRIISGLAVWPGTLELSHVTLGVMCVVYGMAASRATEIEESVVERLSLLSPLSIASLASAVVFLIILFGPSGVPGFIYYQF
jgi:alginate O-acetyltransferase complex protein AlgI